MTHRTPAKTRRTAAEAVRPLTDRNPQVGDSLAGGSPIPASALAVLVAWTVGAGALAALAWRRVLTR